MLCSLLYGFPFTVRLRRRIDRDIGRGLWRAIDRRLRAGRNDRERQCDRKRQGCRNRHACRALRWIIGVVVIRGRREPRFDEIVELAGLRAPWRGCAIGCVAGRVESIERPRNPRGLRGSVRVSYQSAATELALEVQRVDENFVGHRDGLRIGLVAALRQDHLRELLRDVHVGLLQRGSDQRAAAARAGGTDVRECRPPGSRRTGSRRASRAPWDC